ncbi:MAG: restriction endonuclease subunit S, partial [archaeon]
LLKITLDNSKVLNKYFFYLFESDYVQKYLTKISRGVAIKNVPPMKDMKNIEFPIPSIQEQSQIVQEIESRFSIIEKLEETVDSALKKSELLRKSILKSAFEGKLVKEVIV